MSSDPALLLKTDRFLLRPLTLDDLDLCLEMFTDPDVCRFLGGAFSEDLIRKEMPLYVRRCGPGRCIGTWCVVDQESGEKLGTAVLSPMPVELDDTDWDLIQGPDIPGGDIEIGYILRKPAWGRGVATEAAARLLRFAFEDTPLQEVVATIDDANENSRRILRKIGLREVGTQMTYGIPDSPVFRIRKDQWLATPGQGG
ncbi:GNAT family N-acetyltransferase [Rhodovibrionaceae bacterium A322]